MWWRARVAMLAVGIVVVGMVAVRGASAGAAPKGAGGSMSGTVVDAAGKPLRGICVYANGGGSATSDDSGRYSISGVPAGSYPVQFTDCNPVPVYVSQWYRNQSDWSSAEPVAVTEGVDAPLSDAVMQAGVTVTGTVTGTNDKPVSAIYVNVNPRGSGPSAGTQTDKLGVYVTQPLPFGDYRVQFGDSNQPAIWANQFWTDQLAWNNATVLTLQASDGPSRGGVDAHLSAGADVSGTVKGPDGQGVGGICVSAAVPASNGGWDQVGWASTAADGTYTMAGLPPASVKVDFRDCNPTPLYIESWYGPAATFDTATAISLNAGDHRRGVDAQLNGGIAVGGTITDSDGVRIAGINININPANGSGPSGWAQSAEDGTYRTSPVPAGDYRVQFSAQTPNPVWATQYWKGEQSWNSADALTLSTTDDPARLGVDAVLTKGANVSGTVFDPQGAALGGICVNAEVATANGRDQVAWSTTASDGTYTLSGLPVGAVQVRFQDCNHVGPYLPQSWKNRDGPQAADVITLTAGQQQTGIDARLAAAGAISGTVTDTKGAPLGGICVQATTDTSFGGMTRTTDDGSYEIDVAGGGDFHVQFVDCSNSPKYSGTYWKAGPDPAKAAPVTVTAGGTAKGIDATLSAGRVSKLGGKVTNSAGAGVTTACVVAYLPDQYALFSRVQADGSYKFAAIPSGTYALGFVGCPGGSDGDVTGTIADPTSSTARYQAEWWNGVPLDLDNSPNGNGPDPIAEHANLVTIGSGRSLVGYDLCFGCVDGTPPTPHVSRNHPHHRPHPRPRHHRGTGPATPHTSVAASKP